MRSRSLVPARFILRTTLTSVALGGALAACQDGSPSPTGPGAASLAPRASVTTGEVPVRLGITNPSASTYSLAAGSSKQMSGTIYYSKGGTLPSSPYAAWSSSDPCVATVTSAYPSWGKVVGVAPGTARIIASAWGHADTVTVTVTGTGTASSACYSRLWTFNLNDASFTGTPATSYLVKAGEHLSKLVLFAPKDSLAVGTTRKLVGEMWYDQGGKLNGLGYVNFTSTDGSVAAVDFQNGVVTPKARGRTKVIMHLGNMADTVPVYVR
jgi:uncharacterized protein YjdB